MFVIGELLMFVIDWICVASSNEISEPHLLTAVALGSTANAAKTRTDSFNILVKVFLKSRQSPVDPINLFFSLILNSHNFLQKLEISIARIQFRRYKLH